MLETIETMILLLLTLTIIATLAPRLKLPLPILLLLSGMLLALFPHFPVVSLNPEVIFLLFLPPILYIAAWYTSWRDLKDNFRIMLFLAFGLVLATTFGVAWVAHTNIPNMSWPCALLLGAIVSPPDAVAATAITKNLGVPRRIITILEGESLLNDATALVAYRIAIASIMGAGVLSIHNGSLKLVTVGLGGVALGFLIGVVLGEIRKRLNDPPVEITMSLLTPFAAYLPAEVLGVSGVLSVVTTGLYLGWKSPTMVSSMARLQVVSVWTTVIFLLNGFIFLLTGLQFPAIWNNLSGYTHTELLQYAALVSFAVIGIRFMWVYFFTYIPRLLFKSLRERDPYPSWKNVFIISWSGMRGVVSLAAALAIPFSLPSGIPFPHRELIIFLTFSVIFVTLVVQGLTLPIIINFLKVFQDKRETCDEVEARFRSSQNALSHLDQLSEHSKKIVSIPPPKNTTLQGETLPEEDYDWLQQLRHRYEHRVHHFHPNNREHLFQHSEATFHPDSIVIHRQVLAVERQTLIQLRSKGEISEETFHRIEQEIDLEEVRLNQPFSLH